MWLDLSGCTIIFYTVTLTWSLTYFLKSLTLLNGGGGWRLYWFHPVCLFPVVDMILSTHVLRNGCMVFSENLYTYYLPSEDVHLEFSYWLDNFLVGSRSEKAPCYHVQNQISFQSPFCKPLQNQLVLIYNFSDIFPLHLMHSSMVCSFFKQF